MTDDGQRNNVQDLADALGDVLRRFRTERDVPHAPHAVTVLVGHAAIAALRGGMSLKELVGLVADAWLQFHNGGIGPKSGDVKIETRGAHLRVVLPDEKPCPACDGAGWIVALSGESVECVPCDGTGRLQRHTCPNCQGVGKHSWEGKTVECGECFGTGSKS